MIDPTFDHLTTEDLRKGLADAKTRAIELAKTATSLRDIAEDADIEACDAEESLEDQERLIERLQAEVSRRDAAVKYASWPEEFIKILVDHDATARPARRTTVNGVEMVVFHFGVIAIPPGADASMLKESRSVPLAEWLADSKPVEPPSIGTSKGKAVHVVNGRCYDVRYTSLVRGDLTYGEVDIGHGFALTAFDDERPVMLLMQMSSPPDQE